MGDADYAVKRRKKGRQRRSRRIKEKSARWQRIEPNTSLASVECRSPTAISCVSFRVGSSILLAYVSSSCTFFFFGGRDIRRVMEGGMMEWKVDDEKGHILSNFHLDGGRRENSGEICNSKSCHVFLIWGCGDLGSGTDKPTAGDNGDKRRNQGNIESGSQTWPVVLTAGMLGGFSVVFSGCFFSLLEFLLLDLEVAASAPSDQRKGNEIG